MKSTKLLAALLSLTVAAGASVPMGSYVPKHSLTASAESEGSTVNTDELVFKVYADHAEVSGVSNNDLVKCTIPSTVNKVPVTAIAENAFYFSEKLSEVTIPASVSAIGDNAFSWCTDLRAIKVDSANKNFTDVDGVLFSKSKDTIIVYPAGKEGKTYEIADSVKKIASFAFYMSRYIESVKVPESVAYIGQEAFCTCPKLTSVTILDPECKFEYISFICNGKDDKGFSYFNGTLYGYSGSTTEEIAEENNIKFVALDTPAPVTTTTTSTTTTATTTKAATTSTATTTKAAATSTATTTKAATTTTTPAKNDFKLGDVDHDGNVNAADASAVLQHYAATSTGKKGSFTKEQLIIADVNKDGEVNAIDASHILSYYAYRGVTHGDKVMTIEEFIASKS